MGRSCRLTALAGAVLLALATVAACSEPREPGPDVPEQEAALIGAVHEQLGLDPDHDNLRAVLVYVDGDPVLEKYYDWSADTYWDVVSVTNCILSTLVGIAIDEGAIAGLDSTLAELLPDRAADMRREIGSTRLREVLTMTAGFAGVDRDRTLEYMTDPDPVGRILGAAPDPLGGGFAYSNQGAHLLSAVLAQATGESVLEYARSRLFDPLGIDTRPAAEPVVHDPDATGNHGDDGFSWPVDRSGLHLGWGRLKLRPGDLARLGELFLAGGRWHDEQIVPATWVREATTEQIHTVGRTNQQNPGTGYGYGWWLTEADEETAYVAWGAGGQLLEVVPSRSLVVVVATEIENDGAQGGFSSNNLTFLVDDVIAPAVAP